jgi:hypothetical protein
MPPPEDACTSKQAFHGAAFRKLAAHVLRDAGFDAATSGALAELEDQTLLRKIYVLLSPPWTSLKSNCVSQVLGGICHLAKEFSAVSRRTRPSPVDFQSALLEQGISLQDLGAIVRSNKRVRLGEGEESTDELCCSRSH